jgi:hypothetical protein
MQASIGSSQPWKWQSAPLQNSVAEVKRCFFGLRFLTVPILLIHLDVWSASRGLRIGRSTGEHRPFFVQVIPLFGDS